MFWFWLGFFLLAFKTDEDFSKPFHPDRRTNALIHETYGFAGMDLLIPTTTEIRCVPSECPFMEERRRKHMKNRYDVCANFHTPMISNVLRGFNAILVHDERVKVLISSDEVIVRGLVEQSCSNVDEMLRVILRTQANRRTATTQLFSHQSSRSHCVVMITVTQRLLDDTVKVSKLNFGDLAGSELARRTKADGQRLREAGKIHLGLHALERVMNALLSKSHHVPYMESKLTRILKDSLGGNSITTLVVNCSPHVSSRSETKSTLEFAKRAKSIKNRAKINKRLTSKTLQARIEVLEQISHLAQENTRLRRLKQPSMRSLPHVGENKDDEDDGRENEEYIAVLNELNTLREQMENDRAEYAGKLRDFDLAFIAKEGEVSDLTERNAALEAENEELKRKIQEQSEAMELLRAPSETTSQLNVTGPNGENLWEILAQIRSKQDHTEDLIENVVIGKLDEREPGHGTRDSLVLPGFDISRVDSSRSPASTPVPNGDGNW